MMVTSEYPLFVRTQTNGSRTYLLIVDNQWVDGKVKQRVLHRLGRVDELLASGQLDSLLQSLERFSDGSSFPFRPEVIVPKRVTPFLSV